MGPQLREYGKLIVYISFKPEQKDPSNLKNKKRTLNKDGWALLAVIYQCKINF